MTSLADACIHDTVAITIMLNLLSSLSQISGFSCCPVLQGCCTALASRHTTQSAAAAKQVAESKTVERSVLGALCYYHQPADSLCTCR